MATADLGNLSALPDDAKGFMLVRQHRWAALLAVSSSAIGTTTHSCIDGDRPHFTTRGGVQ